MVATPTSQRSRKKIKARKADGIRRRWCKSSRPASGRALMGRKTQNHKTEVHKMSCMVMNPEPLAAIANAAEMLLNCGYEYFGFDAPRSMHDAFQDCRTGYSYDAEGIYKKLYAVNVAAYNGRYKYHETPADDEAPTIDGSRYTVHQRPEYAEHHHAVRPWHYRLAKLLDFWLYQTGEDATWNDPTRAAMVDFQRALFEFIVQRSAEYDSAPAWGRL